jgi:hypothetical protein
MERSISLNAREAVMLADRVQNEDVHFETGEPVGRILQLKLCSVVNELTTDKELLGGEVSVAVTEPEVWLMRQKISLLDKMDGELVGLGLRRKVHFLLIAFNSQVDLPFEEAQDMGSYAQRKEEADARSYPHNPKDGPEDSAKAPA